MKLKTLLSLGKKAVKNPGKIPFYLSKGFSQVKLRLREGDTDFVLFDEQGVTSSVSGYPEFSHRMYLDVTLLEEALHGIASNRSLEIGCGYGRMTPWIARHSNKHAAVEPNTRLLEQAEERYTEVEFHSVGVQKLPFEDDYFDLVVSWTVLQHIPPEDIEGAVEEVKRVTNSEGVVVLAEQTRGEEDFRTFPRTVERYEEMFHPLELKWSEERRNEQGEMKGRVMRFES